MPPLFGLLTDGDNKLIHKRLNAHFPYFALKVVQILGLITHRQLNNQIRQLLF